MKKYIRVEMPDGSEWDVPVNRIMAEYCADHGETRHVPPAELIDYAANNTNWSDMEKHAIQSKPPRDADYQEGWVNGRKKVIEVY